MKKVKKKKRILIFVTILLLIVIISKSKLNKKDLPVENKSDNPISVLQHEIPDNTVTEPARKEINDWRLILVNHENVLPSDFQIELAKFDKIREFDVRAIDDLKQMLEAMKEIGITNVWVQSAYRSVERQEKLFVNKVSEYEAQGMSKENAQNYGFILRYEKEKEAITKVDYEPWHWRYVGMEHAVKMNEMNLCLEEYIEYLSK